MLAQITDAVCEPIFGYLSDRTETKIGKRVPFYIFGHVVALPAFFLLFNPPEFAIGTNKQKPNPSPPFFLAMASIM